MNPFRIGRELWDEAGQVYRTRLHKTLALMLIPFGFLLAANNFGIASQQDPECLHSCVADYSLVGIWLIIVPISMMALTVYYLDMKPTLTRKRMRNGTNGRMSVEQS